MPDLQAWTDLADKTTSQFPTSNDCEATRRFPFSPAPFFPAWRICDIAASGSSESRVLGRVNPDRPFVLHAITRAPSKEKRTPTQGAFLPEDLKRATC